MAIRYQANQPSVAAESIDGETVIVQLRTGDYFSAPGTGCLVWEWLSQGASREEIVEGLTARYAVDRAAAGQSLDDFVADLLSHELLRVWPDAPEGVNLDGSGAARSGLAEWAAPMLEVYSDMKELLLLDPIHEVEEAGWPIAKPKAVGNE